MVGLNSILFLQANNTLHLASMTILGRKMPMFLFHSNGENQGMILFSSLTYSVYISTITKVEVGHSYSVSAVYQFFISANQSCTFTHVYLFFVFCSGPLFPHTHMIASSSFIHVNKTKRLLARIDCYIPFSSSLNKMEI